MIRRREGRVRSLTRPLAAAGILFLAAFLWLLSSHCSRDLAPDAGQGGVDLGWTQPPEGMDLAAPDSLAVCLWVLDARGEILTGPVRAPLAGPEAPIDLSVRVPAGQDRAVRLQMEGSDPLGWGSLAAGQTEGIAIPAGGQAEAVVSLRNTIPHTREIQVAPGALGYEVTWTSIFGAVEYELRETGPGGVRVWSTPDTVWTLDLAGPGGFRDLDGLPAGGGEAGPRAARNPAGLKFGRGEGSYAGAANGSAARSEPDEPERRVSRTRTTVADSTFYRVRSIQPLGGPSLYGDSAGVYLPAIIDLPRVEAVVPFAGQSGVPDTSDIILRFDREMDPGSLSDTTVTLGLAAGGGGVPLTPFWDDPARLRLTHSQPLQRGASYRIRVRTDLEDAQGRPLDQAPEEWGLQGFESRFDTELYNPLRVVQMEPEDGTSGVELRPEILIDLNRAARLSSVNDQTVLLADSLGGAISCDVALLSGSTRIQVRPQAALQFDHGYRLTVTPGVRDMRGSEGEPLDQIPSTPEPDPFHSGFRTLDQPQGPRVEAVFPEDGEPNHKVRGIVRVRFSRPVQTATVLDNNFTVRKQPTDARIGGTITAGPDRTEFTFVHTSLGAPADLERGVRYRVVIDPGGYDSQGRPFGILDDLGVPLDQEPAVPGFQGFSSLFRVEDNPKVLWIQPRDGRDRVPVDTVVVVQFSEPIDRGSVSTTSLGLFTEGEGSPVPLEPYEFSGDTTRVTLRPAGSLTPFRTFQVRADSTLLSTRGSRFDSNLELSGYQPFTARFTTEPESIPPRVEMSIPGSGAAGVAPDVTVEVRFTRQIVPATVNDLTFTLKRRHQDPDSTYLVSAQRAVAADSLSAYLTPADSLRPLTEYEITVSKFVEDRFGVQLDQDPVAPFRQDFVSRFTTDRERRAPQVTEVFPLDGAVDVPETTRVEVWFSEAMDPATLPASVLLLDGEEPVPGTVEMAAGADYARFRPDDNLRFDYSYRVRVETTATDAAGNPLDMNRQTPEADPFESFFTTRPDRIPPRVIEWEPLDGDSAVEVTVRPRLVLSETVDPTTLAGGVFLLDSLETQVPLDELEISELGDEVVLVPLDSLRFHALYSLVVEPTVADTVGNLLDQDAQEPGNQGFRISFRTRRENIPPRVVAVDYPGQIEYEGEPRVPLELVVGAAMSEAVDPSSILPGSVRLFDPAAGQEIAMDLLPLEADSIVWAQSAQPLFLDRVYRLEISGVTDLLGNVLDQDRSTPEPDPFLDTLRTLPDLVPPRVEGVAPSPDSGRISPDSEFLLQMSEPVDETTALFPGIGLYKAGAVPVDLAYILEADSSLVRLVPDSPLSDGVAYTLRVTADLLDRAGNRLDQDPDQPGTQTFTAEYAVGEPPVPRAGPGICAGSDSSSVRVDASASYDPDGAMVRAVWDWGDGVRDSLDIPGPGWPSIGHTYPCVDARGCDGIDNDGDGQIDETGPHGCDESYRIVLWIQDNDGLWASDTTGVAFCAFQVILSDPPDGEEEVDPGLDQALVRFSRPLAPGEVTPARFLLREAGGDTLETTLSLSPDGLEVYLAPDSAAGLAPAVDYEIYVAPGLLDLQGDVLDQDPCTPDPDPFISGFRTAAAQEPSLLRRYPDR